MCSCICPGCIHVGLRWDELAFHCHVTIQSAYSSPYCSKWHANMLNSKLYFMSRYTDFPFKKLNQIFSINILRKCTLIWKYFEDYNTITDYLHLSEIPTQFGSVVTKKFKEFCKACHKSFHPNFERKKTHTTQSTPNSTFLLNGLCRCIQNLDGRDLWHT